MWGKSEGPYAKTIKKTHSGIRQVSGKRARAEKKVRKVVTRHVKADRSNPEKRIDLGWDTSPIGGKGRDSWRKRDRRESPVSSGKKEIA